MQAGHPISWLMFGTLAVVLILVLILAVSFLRKRSNRHPMAGQEERNIGEIRRDAGDVGR